MHLGDVVDQLHDEHGLADAGAAEEADLAALGVGREQIDDLDAGDEDLRLRRLIGEGRGRLMDGASGIGLDGAGLVHRLADDVDDAPERLVADGHRDRRARVDDLLAAHETFGAVHGDRAHRVLARDAARPRAPGGCRGSWSRARSRSRGDARRTARRRPRPSPGESYQPCLSFSSPASVLRRPTASRECSRASPSNRDKSDGLRRRAP